MPPLRALLIALMASTAACGAPDPPQPTEPPSDYPEPCVANLEIGDAVGHADPLGAAAAQQARAGRIDDATAVPQPAHGRQPIKDGDYLLINDKIAVVIEGARLSDGYGRFGGEIVTIDQVDDDGAPRGVSMYGETLQGLGLQVPNPSSVTVMADGSDGGAAIVRVVGKLEVIPFLYGSLSKLFASDYDLEVAYDYVLEPGGERVLLRTSVRNATDFAADFGVELASTELFGFFHTSRNQLVSPALGFSAPESGELDFVGFVAGGADVSSSDDGAWGFAWRAVDGPLEFGLTQSGFSLFHGPGFLADACAITTSDRAELIGGGPYYDGLREAIRRVDGLDSWREVSGVVEDATGVPVSNALVHLLDEDGSYQSRVRTGADGRFSIHAPPVGAITLTAQKKGYRHTPALLDADSSDVVLSFAPHATLEIAVHELGSGKALPVRIQVIPATAVPSYPATYGVNSEVNGRLHQEFAITGAAELVVPPGEHRVLVTRGYEYELFDTTVVVTAGETRELNVLLEHSVDTTDYMCADFHIHSFMSADSSDPIVHKVKGAVVDGLDIPVSSEHEWVVDFAPVVAELGLSEWAFGMASSELTTFLYGHFGVVPLRPEPGAYNNGAVDWIGKSPSETFAAVDDLPDSPALIVNHPRGSIGGYFSAAILDADSATASKPELWSDNFDAIEVFNSSTFDNQRNEEVADWFGLLNNGYRFVAVGSSDSHKLRTKPVGYPRTCMYFGHDDPTQLTPAAVRDAVIGGNSTISGGLYMTVEGPAGTAPGDSLVASNGNAHFTIRVQAPSWLQASELEVLVRGESVATVALQPEKLGTANRYRNEIDVDVSGERPMWVVFHARGNGDLAPLHPGRTAFAVSNPIFVK